MLESVTNNLIFNYSFFNKKCITVYHGMTKIMKVYIKIDELKKKKIL